MNNLLKWGMIVLTAIAVMGGLATAGGIARAQGNIWHVTVDGSDITGDGSEADPFATIQHGIDVASDGDTVLAHPGTYIENINFNGKNIIVASLFHTTGDENYISQTVIDGNQNGSVVTLENGEGPTAVLSGFTITNGNAQGVWPYQSGGGILVYDTAPYLHHLNITNNLAAGEGGGIYLAQNQSNQDVAMVSNCTISNNSAGGSGGGIRFSSDNKKVAVVENSVVTGNTAPTGGGVHIYHSGILKNCLINDNTATNTAGAIYVDWGSSYKGEPGAFITNCTIVDNFAPSYGGLDYVINGAIVKNTIIYSNSNGNWRGGSYTYSCASPVPSGSGNIDVDPLFVDMAGDYRLLNSSPAIGAGTLDGAPNTDIEGNLRPNPAGSNPDMGAYENPLGTSGSMITNAQELQDMRDDLSGNYYLANDIDCSGIANFEPVGNYNNPFVGTFFGNGYTISNLTINRPGENYVGLFGRIQDASITNTALRNVNITGRSRVASLVGYLQQSTVSDSSATGVVTGTSSRIGGLIGESYNGDGISNCQVEVTVNAENVTEVGGFIGRIWDGSFNNITDSFYRGTVNATGSSLVGGFAGYSKSGDFIRCFSTGSVTANNQVGGIVGYTTENAGIHNCYSQSSITGNSDVGGIVGYFNSYHDGASNSYYAGTISGNSSVGGFIGRYNAGALQNNYWDFELSGLSSHQDTGNNEDMSGIDGKTTVEMMQENTFTGWDFNNTWAMVDYPHLQFENTGHPLTLTANPPATVYSGHVAYIPVELSNVHSAYDLRGVQFSLKATDTAVLSPAVHLSPTLGNFFPSGSVFSAAPTGNSWDFLLTDFVSTPAVSGTGVVVNLPFTATGEGCVTLTFDDHQLSDGSAQLISHTVNEAGMCVLSNFVTVTGSITLEGRGSGHYTDTQVVLIGSQESYTTGTNADGNFIFDSIKTGAYTLQANQPLFVQAQRSITVSAETVLSPVELWAGDIDQDADVDQYDWYLLAAAVYPVSDPEFDINDDGATNIQDLVILAGNQGQPDMTTTNPPPRPGLTSQSIANNIKMAPSVGKLKLVSSSEGEMLLRLEEVSEPIYAVGARLALPTSVTVFEVESSAAFSGGFLKWHQEGQTLYIIAAPVEGMAVTYDEDVVIIRGAKFGAEATAIEAENNVPAFKKTIYLPIIIR